MHLSHYTLEFSTIKEMLSQHALSENAQRTLLELTPYLNEDQCKRKMAETTAAKKILEACGAPPLPAMKGLEEILSLCQAGSMLVPEQLSTVLLFAVSCKRVKGYLKKAEGTNEHIAMYGGSIVDMISLREEIERCIRGEQVDSAASSALRDVRRKMENAQAAIKEKLNHILQSRKQWLSDSYISNRNGHFVLPVKKEYRNQFGGTVIEVSGKGGTVFMEPSSISKLQGELTALEVEEDGEIRKILYALSAMVADSTGEIKRNMEAMETLDILFAKAKLSAQMKAHAVEVGTERRIKINKGRHPLLDREICVPLDFEIGDGVSGVIITGPNTGGKTVSVKTVGLLSVMAQCGLHIPCGEGSYICMHDEYWCDIGDGQSITENLSTFSGHMTNIINILENATCDSLVLLDELGSGTDPAEGMGIAIAVLEELKAKGCLFLVTTHYPQVKVYAETTSRIQSARMAFDRESLRPLYRLEMGKAGESCALYIAQRLGLPPHLLRRAYEEAYAVPYAANGSTDFAVPVGEKPPAKARKSKLQKHVAANPAVAITEKFRIGDSVTISPQQEIGIVYKPADEYGQVGVQVKGKKLMLNHTRISLKVSAEELYPADYDFSILFDTVETRKARKNMGKRHDPSVFVQE